MSNKRDDLMQDENIGMGIFGTLGVLIIGIVRAVIVSSKNAHAAQANKEERKKQIQAEIKDLETRRNQYENELFGKLVYSDEINAINRKISRLTNELRAL